jgi:DNA-binding response OmpR family regulator
MKDLLNTISSIKDKLASLKDRPKLLLADDEPTYRTMLEDHFKKLKYEVDVCGDGRSALDHLFKNTYDLIWLDLKMPMVDGMDVIRTMRSGGIKTPVVMVTGYADPETTQAAITAGAQAVISKPHGFDELMDILANFKLQ